ncbi:hypothetical protein [Aquabacter cavernae]|uniref:hypothetical protein n=1 Tax=Aquabacter cavernae TaxID=2496029 RepID=UPI000F8E8AA7|nr:hypothetical protein [Aquabacter cavernae]
MTSFPVDLVLLVALVITSTVVVMLYLKLRSLRVSQAEYEHALGETVAALDTAREAVALLNKDGRNLILSLGKKIDEAQSVIVELDRRQHQAQPGRGPARPISYERRS